MQIKQIPEDFIVEEITKVSFLEKGNYSCYWLTKKNLSTIEAINLISKHLGIPQKLIGFAGNKDKKAITKQLISVPNRFKLKDFNQLKLEFAGFSEERVYLGNLKGNKFIITIRKIKEKPEQKSQFVNYFGNQRFSTNNAEIGKCLVKKNFKKCVELLKKDKKYGHLIEEFIVKNPSNFIGAITQVPLSILRFYINAYQSFLWNKCVSAYLKICECSSEKEFCVIGFDTKEIGTKKEIIEKILFKEGINLRDFVIKQMPELTSEGTKRSIFCEAKDLDITIEKDELNNGFNKLLLKFFLPKGCYATEFVKQLFN